MRLFAEFLDYRRVQAEDVALKMLEDQQLQSIMIGLVQGWSVLLLLALAIWGVTRYRRGR